jgi:multiple sugar transport system permease protein
VIGFLAFWLGPLLASAALSLTNWNMLASPTFLGLANYQRLLTDPRFLRAFEATTLYAVLSVPAGIALGFGLAVLLNHRVAGVQIFRTICYAPAVLAGVAVALLWKWMYNAEFGLLNLLLSYLGISGPAWLNDPNWALASLILMSLWHVGGSMVIYLAGLQGIPQNLYEAAQVDGATAWQRMLNVTLPLMTPVLFFQLVMGIILGLQVFTQPFIMTKGGPEDATLFFMLYLYQRAFVDFRMGYASALAWVLFLYILGLTFLVFRSSSMWVYYESELKGRRR